MEDLINTIEERVHLLFENLVDEGLEVLNDFSFDDLAMDSFDKIDLSMDLEEEFNLDIPDSVTQMLETVGEIVEYIVRRLGSID